MENSFKKCAKKKGVLVVVSGFSGAGKGTLMKRLLEDHDNYALSISATTRAKREGEYDGREYFFMTQDDFLQKVAHGEFYEYACYSGNYYGTPRAYVDEQLANGKDVILEIEVQGAKKIKEQFPDTLLIFVTPPNAHELHRRLKKRGTETMDMIAERMTRAISEAEEMVNYDYLLINDDLDSAVEKLHTMIHTEHMKAERSTEVITQITKELIEIAKGVRRL